MFSPLPRADARLANHLVEQRGSRFCIVATATGQVIYTPPDFLKAAITSPADLQLLAQALDHGERYIDAVTAFEADRADELRARHAVSEPSLIGVSEASYS
ncbi:hypothetical protein MOX02_57950 [Methylobacterium oxalidis]|uniref:Uncharacterized protein n=1 Tax=Methylobacterium oxalidis TaxID=944322 RepID=A0A512JCX8_9HYPH|nr:hypothetical protein MOX02_57950 [Methylobacterium oxalidis]GLS65803.1 hypothetical protein GCM10007888_41850 [Methylobacterium oxalidis]